MVSWRSLADSARSTIDAAVMKHQGRPVGTLASRADTDEPLNYDQCFTRDFVVSAITYLLAGRPEIVRNFLEVLVELQSRERHMDCFRAGKGLMPASFDVEGEGEGTRLIADFGENAIARVAPVDAALWWLYLLRIYCRTTGDEELAQREEFRTAIENVVELYLTPKFEMMPTILVPDGAYLIDRRMGVYGHPFDVQALFHAGLRSARELLGPDHAQHPAVTDRIGHLTHHLRRYYWLDFDGLNQLYRSAVEQYGPEVTNRYNIYPESIPQWLLSWLPPHCGYFAGNLGPGRVDFRFFSQGNLLSVLSALATDEQAADIMEQISANETDLIGEMPMKVAFPALQGQDWRTITGSDPKNSAWSYHNGGSWPCLLWLLAAAAKRTGAEELAEGALQKAAERLQEDDWPEYYDGPEGRLVGKRARTKQTWTAAGMLAAIQILHDDADVSALFFDDDPEVMECVHGHARAGD